MGRDTGAPSIRGGVRVVVVGDGLGVVLRVAAVVEGKGGVEGVGGGGWW